MTGRVGEHPEVVGARLVVGLDGAELDHGGLADVEVVDVDVEVRLLGHRPVGPRRSDMTIDLLERDLALRGVDLDPSAVRVLDDAATDDGPIEPGQGMGIGAVEGGHVKSTDG